MRMHRLAVKPFDRIFVEREIPDPSRAASGGDLVDGHRLHRQAATTTQAAPHVTANPAL
jgi:hypothetical protein